MNCKQGDLAYVTSMKQGGMFYGHIVRCIEPTVDRIDGQPGWIVEPRLGHWRGVHDSALRPIRPGDITDEEVRDLYAPKVPEAA